MRIVSLVRSSLIPGLPAKPLRAMPGCEGGGAGGERREGRAGEEFLENKLLGPQTTYLAGRTQPNPRLASEAAKGVVPSLPSFGCRRRVPGGQPSPQSPCALPPKQECWGPGMRSTFAGQSQVPTPRTGGQEPRRTPGRVLCPPAPAKRKGLRGRGRGGGVVGPLRPGFAWT